MISPTEDRAGSEAEGQWLFGLFSLLPALSLGLKAATSFNMFSNLRTEPGYWNHAFVPEAVRIFPYQDDLVAGTNVGEQREGLILGRIGRFQPVPETERRGC